MYLSRLAINPRSRDVQQDLADIYQMHRTVMSAFPPRRGRKTTPGQSWRSSTAWRPLRGAGRWCFWSSPRSARTGHT